MRRVFASFLVLFALQAAADEAGDFDYWVLALSWSPGWCDRTGAAREAAQCAPGRRLGWSLHGLWPQHERGWPSDCRTARPGPGAADTAAMADIMGSAGLAAYQWRKHGTCSGLAGADYLALSRLAFDRVARPSVFRALEDPVRLPAAVIEEAFLDANPGLHPDGITITCRNGQIAEARLCLDRDLRPRRCAPDTRRDCAARDALVLPIR